MYQFFRNQQRLICFISKFKKFALCVAEKYMVWIFCIIWYHLDRLRWYFSCISFGQIHGDYTNQNTFLLNGIYYLCLMLWCITAVPKSSATPQIPTFRPVTAISSHPESLTHWKSYNKDMSYGQEILSRSLK